MTPKEVQQFLETADPIMVSKNTVNPNANHDRREKRTVIGFIEEEVQVCAALLNATSDVDFVDTYKMRQLIYH